MFTVVRSKLLQYPTAMDYTLNVRALSNLKRKDKVASDAARALPRLPIEIVGHDWKDPSLWELRVHQDCEYDDDKTALWETLHYFRQQFRAYSIVVGPNEDQHGLLISAFIDDVNGGGIVWCGFELWRGAGQLPIADR